MKPALDMRRARGFSLVEMLVALAVGLVALLFATRLVVNGELNKDAAVGGSDSMQNGMLALYSLSNDASQSGWGLNDTLVAGCPTSFTDASGYTLASVTAGGVTSTPLAAVIINSNGAGPDQISMYTGSSQSGVGSLKVNGDVAPGATTITTAVNSPYGFGQGDVLVLAPEPATAASPNCVVLQMSGLAADSTTVQVGSGASYRFNPPGGVPYTYKSGQARLFNLGKGIKLAFHTWTLNNGVLLLQSTDLSGSSQAPVSVTDNIVSIKGQYGFDTRAIVNYNPAPPPNGNGMQVTQWSSTMINADNDGVTGGPGDWQRIVAVRLAVVARSKSPEKPNLSGQCTATTTQPTVFTTTAPATVPAVPVTVNVAVTGDPVDWKCYRYRVFETIVPIRNAQWRP
jgi:type IV pilus assembly protein PilW